MTHGAESLRTGAVFIQDCPETTRRLRCARALLRYLGVEDRVSHSDECLKDRIGACKHNCTTQWSTWASDEIFELAYALADESIGRRGAHLRLALPTSVPAASPR
jgi:hypothetical protein